jgi:hypothetical protein
MYLGYAPVQDYATRRVQFLDIRTSSTCVYGGTGLAVSTSMITILSLSFLFLSCTTSTLPQPHIPPGTLVMREAFQGPGPERTGNWWGRFDTQGCWWEGHNTWLVVTDEVLAQSPAHPLYWNAVEPDVPWFCLTPSQLAGLRSVVGAVGEPGPGMPYRGPMDRWTVIGPEGAKSLVQAAQTYEGEWQELTDFFRLLSTVNVWGQSPEKAFTQIPA